MYGTLIEYHYPVIFYKNKKMLDNRYILLYTVI